MKIEEFEWIVKEYPQKEERMYDLKEFGYSHTQRWYEVFETEPEDSLYIRDMLQSGEKLSEEARVKLSTIHSAKGGEAENATDDVTDVEFEEVKEEKEEK